MDVIGTITSVIELFSVAKGLFDRYQDAPRAVLELKSDCEWTRRLCCGLKDEILKDPDILQDGVTDDPLMWCFRRAMRDITNTIRKIERELDKVDSRRISRQNTSMGRRDRARFIWREDQFRDASQNVRNQRDMISSTIAGLQLRQSQKVLTLMRSVQPPAPTPTHYIEPEPVPTHLVDPDIPQSVLAEIISNLIPQPNLGLGDAGVEERDESFAADLHNAVNSGQVANLHAVLARNGPIDTKLNADGDRALHIAARNGYSLILGRLLAAGADVDVQNDALCTPLISALSRRQIEAAMTLLFEDADWKHENANDLTALHLAARGSIRLVIEYLLEKGADPNLQDDQGQTPLFLACRPSDEDGNLLPMDGEIIRLLIHHGADPTITTRGVGFTPMHILARDGYAKELELVATVTASYDIRAGGMYYTPLELAITSSHLDVVESLIKLKANVNTRRVTGDSVQTPLWYATLCNNPEITTKLLEASADPNVKLRDGMTVLHFATEKKRADIVKTLVTFGADVNAMTEGGDTPLKVAMSSGDLLMACLLLDKDTNVMLRDNDGLTLLHLAVRQCLPEFVRLLVEFKADLNAKANDNSTPLYIAVSSNDLSMSRLLLDSGAAADAKSLHNATPFMFAAQIGSLPLMRLLRHHGAECLYSTPAGTNAFLWACHGGHLACASFLLGCGQDLNHKTAVNSTALHYAARKGHLEVVMWLLELGIDKKVESTKIWSASNVKGTAAEVARGHGHVDVAEYIETFEAEPAY